MNIGACLRVWGSRVLNSEILRTLEKIAQLILLNRKYKENSKGNGNSEHYKGKKGEREGSNKVKCKHQCANVTFSEIANDSPGNTAISTDQEGISSGENRANSTDRELLISKTALRQTEWVNKPWGMGGSKNDCYCIIDTGFNGGDCVVLTGCTGARHIYQRVFLNAENI